MTWIKKEDLFILVALLLIMIIAIRTPLDTDMWWHIKAGEQTWMNKSVYSVDTLSHTRAGETWINHSWLSQVFMYFMYNAGGYYALSIWVALCSVISMGFVYLTMQGSSLIKIASLLLAGIVSSVVWSPRPQIFSLVLLSLQIWLFFLYKEKRNFNILIWFLPLFLVWSNLHAGYMLGFIFLGLVIGGEILNQILRYPKEDSLSWREIGILIGLLLMCWIIILINPFGVEIWKLPFNTVGLETLQDLISEWSSPDFHQGFQQPMLIMLLIAVAAIGLAGKRIDGSRLLPMIGFCWLAMVARRNFGPFAIVTAPVLSKYLSSFLDDWLKKDQASDGLFNKLESMIVKSNQEPKPALRNIINVSLLLLLMIAVGWKAVDVNQIEFINEVESKVFPVRAVEWMAETDFSGKLFNNYNWGGYIIWHLPDTPLFVDGRTDLFGDQILTDYMAVITVDENWQEVLDEYEIDTLLVPQGSLISKVAELTGWKIIYRDEIAVIMQN